MKLPIGLDEFILWMAVSSIIMLIISELINPYYSRISIIIEKGRLRRVAHIFSFIFLSTVAIRIYQIIITL